MRSPWLLMKSSTWASYYSNPKKIPRLVFPGCQFDIVRWYMSFIFHDIFHFWPLFWRLRPKKRWPGLAFFNHGIGWNPPPSPPLSSNIRSWRRRSEVRPWSFMAYKTPWSLRLLGFLMGAMGLPRVSDVFFWSAKWMATNFSSTWNQQR